MQTVPLTAAARDTSSHAKRLRASGRIPCVVYGNTDHAALECEENALHKVYAQAGESTLVELSFGSAKVPVLIHAVQFDPISGKIAHVDFYAVDMKKEIEAHVPVHFEGVAPAIKDLGGIFVAVHDHVTVKCLPANLPHALVVDISGMANFHDTVTVAGLKLPEGVAVVEDAETVIAVVQQPREDEPEPTAAVAEGADAAAAPGAEGAEGAAAPAAEGAAKEEAKK